MLAVPVFALATQVKSTVVVKRLAKSAATAVCPGSEHVAFGGLTGQFSPVNDELVFPTGMRESAAGKWTVYGQSVSTTRGSQLTAVAYCSNAPAPTAVQETVSVAKGHLGRAVAKCPAGTVVVGGGFNTKAFPQVGAVAGLERIAADAWRVSILNIGDGPTTVTAIAYCGAGPAPTAKSAAVLLRSGAIGTAKATCPGGTALLFGGEIASASGLADRLPHVLAFSFAPVSNTQWNASGGNGGGSPGWITALAYCR